MKFILLWIWLILLLSLCTVQGQDKLNFFEPSDTFHQQRFHIALASAGLTYAISIATLYQVWYKDYPRSDFHFFNDFAEWNQMDKFGFKKFTRLSYASGVYCLVSKP